MLGLIPLRVRVFVCTLCDYIANLTLHTLFFLSFLKFLSLFHLFWCLSLLNHSNFVTLVNENN